ncbi:transposase [Calditrichota bacterium LG25]
MPRYDPQKHHRRSIRLKGWDYRRPGYYFVTMVVHNRECLFGRVVNGKMVLNAFGKIADYHWKKLSNHFKHIELDEFRIMPNHLHGIIHIVRWPDGVVLDDDSVGAKDFPEQFNTGENTSLPNENMPNDKNGVGNPSPLPYGEQCQSLPRGTLPGSLSAIIQNYCNVTTRKINRIRRTPGARLWQRNYWEHIIRDENELNRIRQYIKNNPLKWTDDDYFETV